MDKFCPRCGWEGTPIISPIHHSGSYLCNHCQWIWIAGDVPNILQPEWVKLIPADSIPVFCFAPETYDQDLERYGDQLRAFFGERKVLAIRGVVDIYAIAEKHDE